MAEAIVRVQRSAGDISRTIEGVGRQAQELVEQLAQIDTKVAGATKTLEDYRRLVRRGVALNPQQAQSYGMAERFVREKAPEQLRSQGAPESLIEDLRRYADRSAAVAPARAGTVAPPRREPLPSTSTAGGRSLSSLSARELEREERRLAREITRVERDVDRLVGDQSGAGGASLRQAALAADPARRELLERKREVDARLAAVRASSAEPAADGPLTDAEREQHRRLGTTDEQLDRARRLRPGTIIIPPPEARPVAPAPAAAAASDFGGPGEPPPSVRQATVAATARVEADAAEDVTQALRGQGREYQQVNREARLQGLTSKELQREWRENARALREQERELDRAQGRFSRLQELRSRGGGRGPSQSIDFEELPGRIRDLRAGMTGFRDDQRLLEAEAHRRGGRVEGGQMMLGRPSAGRQAFGAFIGGAGLGGGSIGGAVLGGMIGGGFNPWVTAAGVAGAGLGWLFRQGDRYEETQRLVFDTGMQLGGGFGDLRRGAHAAAAGPLRLRFEESLGARRALAVQTGRTDVEGINAFARAYGLPVEQTAALLGSMGKLGVMPEGRRTAEIPPTVVPPPPARPRLPKASELNPLTPEEIAAASPKAFGIFDPSRLEGPAAQRMRQETIARALEARRAAGRPLPVTRRVPEPVDTARPVTAPAPLSRTRGGFGDLMAGILAGGYRRSAWGGLPADRRDALMQSYTEQSAALMQVQAGGGAPILDWTAMPSMLAEASRSYGPNVAPEIPARVVGGFTRAMTQPQGDVMRGAAMRSVMNLGRGMSGEQLEDFKKKTGGIDLRSYTGVLEAIQNSAALPTEQRQQVMRAVLQGYRSLTGKGTEFERIMWTGMTGGQAHVGRKATELADRFLEGTITPEQTTEFEKMFRRKADEAGSEANPFINAARADELAITAGEPLKRISQGLADAVYDFVDKLREAESALQTGVLQTPMTGMSEGR